MASLLKQQLPLGMARRAAPVKPMVPRVARVAALSTRVAGPKVGVEE